jgi:Putative glucoamylase/Protein of unknown function (DUF3131)
MRRFLLPAAIAVVAVVSPALSGGSAGATDGQASANATLKQYASTTWASFVAMTYAKSGLPADSLGIDGTRSVQTSTTNIAAYMWSAVVAENLGIIGHGELVSRLGMTLTTLEHMERHQASGQFYNWYDARNGAKLTVWPPTGQPLTPILSSVDNGWLATGLRIVRGAVPALAARAGALYDSMNFSIYYRADVNRILFFYEPSNPAASACCYDTIVSESRIADYIGIANGQLPQREYFGSNRAFPANCADSFQETLPSGPTNTYYGQTVFDGSYQYAGMRITPSWGGSAFEDLMPALFVPEETWGPHSWGLNHPNTVRAQMYHGLVEADYGYWGFSPSNNPDGGYSAYGVDAVGSNPDGYPSNNDNTLVDAGFNLPGCVRPAKPAPPPSAYTNGVVTPHASFLGLRWDRDAVLANLDKLRSNFDIYTKWGFRDSVDVGTGGSTGVVANQAPPDHRGVVSPFYLALDQGIIMAAIGNELSNDLLRRAFSGPDMQSLVQPVIGVESFNDSP